MTTTDPFERGLLWAERNRVDWEDEYQAAFATEYARFIDASTGEHREFSATSPCAFCEAADWDK